MLSPHEFSANFIGRATQLSFVLPIDEHDRACLVTSASGEPVAVVVDQRGGVVSFSCENNTSWKGILVPEIRIEIDETTAFDPVARWPPYGTLVRQEDSLFVVTKPNGFPREKAWILLLNNLPAGQANMAVGFKKWQLSVGEGLSKRSLMKFDTDIFEKSQS